MVINVHTLPGDQSHDNCDGFVYVGDGYVEQPNSTRAWGPKFVKCGTCELLGLNQKPRSATLAVDPFKLVSNPNEIDIPF